MNNCILNMFRGVSKRSVSGIITRHRNVHAAAPFLSSNNLSAQESNDVKCKWYSSLPTGRSDTGLPKTHIHLRNGLFLGNRYESTSASTEAAASDPPAETYEYQAETPVVNDVQCRWYSALDTARWNTLSKTRNTNLGNRFLSTVAHSPKSVKQSVCEGLGNATFYLKRDDKGFVHPKWLQNLLVRNYSQIAGLEVEADVSKKEGEDGIGNSNLSSSSNNILRPLSPHLPVYMPQVSSTSSILHRISWCLLTFMALSAYFLCLKMGLICFTYAAFYQVLFAASKLILISAEMSALAMVYLIVHLFV